MPQASRIVLPYEPAYTGHREAARRREETAQWLRQRERAVESPSTVPEPGEHADEELT